MKCPACGTQLPGTMAFCPQDGHALAPMHAADPTADTLLHTRVSEYVLQERIGAGGMGIVYRAIQPLIGKQVAIKVLKAEYAGAQELVQRLLVEARAVNAIQHRGIIDIFGFGELPDGRPYVVMELLHGVPLSTYLRKRRRLGADEAAVILDEMLAALGAAHRAGVIHRDLKPGNVFLVEGDGGARSVKVLDFGIAKVAEGQVSRPLTQQGHILGTPEYMAPEQVRGEKVDPTADLYAVGVLAFQMLTGKLPFAGEPMRVLMAQVNEKPPALSSLAPEVPSELESLVLRLLAKHPSKRPTTAEAVRLELSRFLSRRAAAPTELTHGSQVAAALGEATSGSRGSARKNKPLSMGAPTVEVPMLAAPAEETAPSLAEPGTGVPLQRPARPLWLMGVGAAALVLSGGVVGAKVLRRTPPVPEAVAEARAPSAPAPAPQLSSPPAASTVALVTPREASTPAEATKDASPKVASAAPRAATSAPRAPRPAAVAKAVAPKPPAAPAEGAASPNTRVDQKTLMGRLKEAEARLQKLDPAACPVTASTRLKALQHQATLAVTDAQRMKLVASLGEWEQEFLPKR